MARSQENPDNHYENQNTQHASNIKSSLRTTCTYVHTSRKPELPVSGTQVGALIPITTPPQWGEQLPHGTHSRTPLHASPTMPYTS
jgi:hypothetical protein